jgi:NAD(P)-dependent dehydrogenase (short-subunit alcohol dehydrogenase family)
MSDNFDIKPHFGATLWRFFTSQLFYTTKYPTQSFAGQTIIVTGSNTGLGLEAARHFYRLNCAKVILAVRTIAKGEEAKEYIVRSEPHRHDGATAIEVWQLDLNSTQSTLDFADKVNSLPRLDAIVENAGVAAQKGGWTYQEGFETIIQVNVINTLLLALLVLPKLRETKKKFPDSTPHLEIVASEVHRFTKFPQASAPDLYAKLNEKEGSDINDRYNVSKLLEVLFVRELVTRIGADDFVSITIVNPGLCMSSLNRDGPAILQVMLNVVLRPIVRSTEQGARALVHGASVGMQSHGKFMSNGENEDVEAWIETEMGKKVQEKVFEQTMRVLEERKPGVGKSVGI